MRKLILSAGVAALAIAAPAAAKPEKGGGGHGGGQGQVQRGGGAQAHSQRGGEQRQAQVKQRGGGQRQAQVQRGGGQQRMAGIQRQRGGGQHVERRGGGQQRVANDQRAHGNAHVERGNTRRFANFQTERGGHGNAQRAQRAENHGHANRDLRTANRGNRDVRVENREHGNRDFRVANQANREFRMEDRGHGKNREVRAEKFGNHEFHDRDFANVALVRAFNDDRALRTRDDFRRVDRWRNWNDGDWDRAYSYRGIPASFVGCPPGLAKKSPACVPPGLARNEFVGRALPTVYASNYFPQSLRYLYADTPDYYYRWGDGYAYRVNRTNNLVAALLPLVGAGYGIGQPFPYMSDPYYNVPSYYQSFYPNYGNDYYRYANGYVYEIDGGTGYIEDVIPLLDRGYGVGQMLPTSYSYYNVPYQYRDVYYDNPDYYYRYAPGAIYQVDRSSQLITAIASLLTGGLAVGQPLPPAYSTYNVPMQYRTSYYDTPDAWYRYSDGYIYQVDPTTQLITAMVRSIV